MYLLSEQQAARRWRVDKGIGGLQLPKLTPPPPPPPKLPDKTATEKSLYLCLLLEAVAAIASSLSPALIRKTRGEENLYGPQKL